MYEFEHSLMDKVLTNIEIVSSPLNFALVFIFKCRIYVIWGYDVICIFVLLSCILLGQYIAVFFMKICKFMLSSKNMGIRETCRIHPFSHYFTNSYTFFKKKCTGRAVFSAKVLIKYVTTKICNFDISTVI